ncbi:N(4)-(Beta-N-acetylglucosaminyl)-L-asparaginase-like [Anthonomus grandis grandis]|uniref:N(4)-(Beta-N-acetylglucosaminyl)-L-asparaginase- like n=1 Tax=Anthonomus grandis grandis TaxID=2921223 RepID=UPI0021664873|nr:N(4)-(Beta-N-acetylglucosaminyl)-L-asparaginase-like [Anthonomus grandis grandis]XP_050303244.1 N(4)-(Beta-N-acetylglucosaminyl)-L-asparaginase-like [Anthonomus grandis grandis]
MRKLLPSLLFLLLKLSYTFAGSPFVATTWAFTQATINAWEQLNSYDLALDALTVGCRTCQAMQCDFTVGYGGSPDENGESTLDALIFDGNTMNMGAVGGLRGIKDAIGVARKVLENTQHSFLVGSLATAFAKDMGFPEESLTTNYSSNQYETWKESNCQPNFWQDVTPDPTKSCGPYKPKSTCSLRRRHPDPILTNEIPQDIPESVFNTGNHDTIGMIVMNAYGHLVAGTSTNGANHKIPGRVGDSPIPGAGAYADSEVGAAVGTGDGDVMMRFLPSFLAVEQMRQGATPSQAAQTAIDRITRKYPSFFGGIVAVDKNGTVGAACNGMDRFPYTVANRTSNGAVVYYADCKQT